MSLSPTESGVRVCFGLSGSGKSYSIADDVLRASAAGLPVVVVDSMHEWTAVPPNLRERTITVDIADLTAKHLNELAEEGFTLMIVRPDTEAQAIDAVERACRWAIRYRGETVGRGEYPAKAGVAVPEAWQVAPTSGRLSPALAKVTRAWRHRNVRVALWLDAQRVTMMSRNVTELAREVRCFAMAGDRDMKVLTDIGTPALADAVRQCAQKYAEGERGWHVSLGAKRIGPYQITRRTRHA